MKIGPVGAELFHAGVQIDRHDEANSRFYPFCKRPYKSYLLTDVTSSFWKYKQIRPKLGPCLCIFMSLRLKTIEIYVAVTVPSLGGRGGNPG